MPKTNKTLATEELLSAWVSAFGGKPVTVADAIRSTKKNRRLRQAMELCANGNPAEKSGHHVGGLLRSAAARGLNGYLVTREIQRNATNDRLAAKWTVTSRTAEIPAADHPKHADTSPVSAGDDDRLMAVLLSAQSERVITGTQADRILALWCEKVTP